jgi:hypothetical protein
MKQSKKMTKMFNFINDLLITQGVVEAKEQDHCWKQIAYMAREMNGKFPPEFIFMAIEHYIMKLNDLVPGTNLRIRDVQSYGPVDFDPIAEEEEL